MSFARTAKQAQHKQARSAEAPAADYPQALRIEELSIGHELTDTLNKARLLYADVQVDENVPANQKAQTLNTITSLLVQISKAQAELYNVERMKEIEQILLNTLRKFPELQKDFLEAYEERLKAIP